MADILRAPFQGPSAWTRADMERDTSWRYVLDGREVQELRDAVQAAKACGLPLEEIEARHFPLPTLTERIERLAAAKLQHAIGFCFFILLGYCHSSRCRLF